ncbi:ankyrin repeat domain-containing protein [Allofrancisella frigidaquae]|uniref:Ankyrin repeat domain-containing protein n=1 Tax=Allofrancisella frigidaquae TaxID=1085644 RepID=A0A6M3HUF0_9GAMM|nr:ankyrin repeat domain-containing protein [Allofrancisella frigidaquae]QIV94809.1 ankyrin repeat domain-containing protein [Allofrancisella frigidaquae]
MNYYNKIIQNIDMHSCSDTAAKLKKEKNLNFSITAMCVEEYLTTGDLYCFSKILNTLTSMSGWNEQKIKPFVDKLLEYDQDKFPVISKKSEELISTQKFVSRDPSFVETYNYPFIGTKREYCDFLEPIIENFIKNKIRFCISLSSFDRVIAFVPNGKEYCLYNVDKLKTGEFTHSNVESFPKLIKEVFQTFNRYKEEKETTVKVSGSGPRVSQHVFLALNVLIQANLGDNYHLNSMVNDDIKGVKSDTLNELNKYIGNWKWKNHKNRAKYTINQLRQIEENKFYKFIKEEKSLLSNENLEIDPDNLHYKDNRQSSDNNLHKSTYAKIISNALQGIKDIYAKRGLIDSEHYKNSLLAKIKNVNDSKNANYADSVVLLCLACAHDHIEIVRLTKVYYVDEFRSLLVMKWVPRPEPINPATNDGQTPLYIACSYGYTEIVKLLLKISKGAGIDNATNDGQTPLSIARENDHTTIVNLLEERSRR